MARKHNKKYHHYGRGQHVPMAEPIWTVEETRPYNPFLDRPNRGPWPLDPPTTAGTYNTTDGGTFWDAPVNPLIPPTTEGDN
jgi:hypothetical protein